jgi:MoxR-like ATPase
MMLALLALLLAAPEGLALRTIDGRNVEPFAGAQRATVFVFVRPQCPVSGRYAPELNRLHEESAARNIRMWLVYPGRDDEEAAIRAHHREFRLQAPALRDPSFTLARLAGATVAPEAAVFAGDGRVIYRGRIDDRAVRLGVWQPAARTRDLASVLDRLARGEAVPPFTTRAVGCFIRPLS